MSHRDAVAQIFKENREIVFTGNGYSAEWPVEAKKRGLPNDNTTPLACAKFNSAAAKKVFEDMKIFSAEEVDARAEVMFENYVTTLDIEINTLISMIETGILPACAKDMAKYAAMKDLAGDRDATYKAIKTETDKLKAIVAIRPAVDKAEGLIEAALYPYPTYEAMLYSHHS